MRGGTGADSAAPPHPSGLRPATLSWERAFQILCVSRFSWEARAAAGDREGGSFGLHKTPRRPGHPRSGIPAFLRRKYRWSWGCIIPQCGPPGRSRTSPAAGTPCRRPAAPAGSRSGSGRFPARSPPRRRCCLRRCPAGGRSPPRRRKGSPAAAAEGHRGRDSCWCRFPERSR